MRVRDYAREWALRKEYARTGIRHWRTNYARMTATEFWAKTEPEPNSGCWLWPRGNGRYGQVGKDARLAHREAWRLSRGPIPDGLHVCHRCDVPSCVNPDHLFLGTQSDNLRDCVAKGRHRNQHTI